MERLKKYHQYKPDADGTRTLESVCFHCRKKLHLEIDPDDKEGYMIFEYDEKI